MRYDFVYLTDINECLDSPCQNGGVCSNSVGAYSCDCTDTGYNGTNCETGMPSFIKKVLCLAIMSNI